MEEFSKIQPHVQLEIKNALESYSRENMYTISNIPVHEHSGRDSVPVQYKNLQDKNYYIVKSLDGSSPQTATNYGVIFIAPFDCAVTSIIESHQTAGTDAGAVTLNVERLTGTQSLDSGSNILTTSFNLKNTANTVQYGVISNNLNITRLKKGDRLALKDSGTLTSVVGVCIIIEITY